MSSEHPLSVVLAGGGSAGHVSPLLAIAAALRDRHAEVELLAVGTKEGLETRLVPAAGVELTLIDRVPLPRRPSLAALKFPTRMRKAIRDSERILIEAKADVLLGVGGFVCTPMYVAAKKAGIPIVIHEANLRPGLANRLGARSTSWIGTAFEGTKLKAARWVGMPIRRQIAQLERAVRPGGSAQRQAKTELGFDADRPLLVVTGGSLGAQRINQALVDSLPALTEAAIQVLHITGRGKQVREASGQLVAAAGYQQIEYLDGMEDAYAAADLLICRAGAGTVSEVAAVGVPAVFVPLPVGNGEQALNAATLVDRQAALSVADKDFTPEWLRQHVLPLVTDPARLEELARRAAQLGIRDAAEKMAEMIVQAVR
ncbi:undecaprenyldiphospho-muramoylpentapeptide beta-N-acetylglucosaminyltransferase [Psychromicrobium lacuslunae]|uniref:UDP-N-acetylglucosamine--N-acetylmuramyl-(pentapeptide) pyrophosphoryl-undecaprenol N-acetylglucosamine transferase n=1 Tax=Psychromicrobium lacuslunae TaxID=1618207 RepID=A0A0D4BWL7_9MICC|nr:undecaprenyldiphospho-muramoylpentapeptide beta-N-acetylglucosaminyltransferase [Psychromicrobium lacuslunae]AJT40718.1 UDP-diphospho-muramoylpentapeptide beta-N-acetylglucosaminyltransferase [Psychromicrobium lacuslunae]